MKKIAAMIAALAVCLSLAACSGTGEGNSSTTAQMSSTLSASSQITEVSSDGNVQTAAISSKTPEASSSKREKVSSAAGTNKKPGKPSSTSSKKNSNTASVVMIDKVAPVVPPVTKPNQTSSKATTDKTSSAAGEQTMTLEELVALSQDEIKDLSESLKQMGLEVKLEARNKSMVYSYRYIGEAMLSKEQLDANLEAAKDTFSSVLSGTKQAEPDTKSLIVEYLDKNGDVITSREFK